MLHRKTALSLIKDQLLHLVTRLSVSAITNPVPYLLSEAIEKKSKALGEPGEKAIHRNPYEPWRQYVNLVLLQLENTMSENFADAKRLYYFFIRNIIVF